MTTYPETRRGDVVEVLHGRSIADPYRWLEDPDAPETADWVRRQNEVSGSYLSALPERAWFGETMAAILARPRAGVPFRRAGWYFVTRNNGRQNQDVLFVAETLEELLAGGRVLIDPNTLSADGTTSLNSFTVSPDGRLAAYGISEAGSDWVSFRLLEVASGEPVADAEIQTKFSEACWLGDSASYVYLRFDPQGAADGTKTDALPAPQLRLHRLGRPAAEDEVVLEFPDNDQLFLAPETTSDDAYLVVSIAEGTESRNRVWVYPVSEREGRSELGEPIKLVDEPVAEFALAGSEGDQLYFRTDFGAERGRGVLVDLASYAGTLELVEVIAAGEHALAGLYAVGDELLALYLADASPRLERFARNGRPLGTVAIEGGAPIAVNGREGRGEVFAGMSSITSPTRSYRIDLGDGEVTPLDGLVQTEPGGFTPPPVRQLRRRARSADGTEVGYFLIVPEGADLSRPLPTLLWGYGGFNIPVFADYRPGWSGWLAAGGAVAIANLRGGGEYGSAWHEDGRLQHKQHVFDDFIALAEHLQQTGVTTAAQLAIHGRSNGGLLVGAVMTQRPELFGVALPVVGVLDMLRFHKFTVGAAWISDYGSPDDPAQFADLLAYSPLHNVRGGGAYPATLISTGDHDDRVVPLHSHKFAAALQRAQAGEAPILTRIEVATGHGMGKPTALVAAEWADLLAFAAHHTGLAVPAVSAGG